jgi:hypothetical protein
VVRAKQATLQDVLESSVHAGKGQPRSGCAHSLWALPFRLIAL